MPVPKVTTKTVTLAALDIDAKRLPDLTAIRAKTMPALMDTFDDSLDACCMDCHVRDDPKAPTVEKRIAHEMWSQYAREFTTVDGGAVYCDSCHQGQLRFLDRSDSKALSTWMQTNYVDKLRLRDGSRVECATCHGRPFEPHIFQNLWSARKG